MNGYIFQCLFAGVTKGNIVAISYKTILLLKEL